LLTHLSLKIKEDLSQQVSLDNGVTKASDNMNMKSRPYTLFSDTIALRKAVIASTVDIESIVNGHVFFPTDSWKVDGELIS
jgi:hypothetical protein